MIDLTANEILGIIVVGYVLTAALLLVFGYVMGRIQKRQYDHERAMADYEKALLLLKRIQQEESEMSYVYIVMYGCNYQGDEVYAVYDTEDKAEMVKNALDEGDRQYVLKCKVNEPDGDPFHTKLGIDLQALQSNAKQTKERVDD